MFTLEGGANSMPGDVRLYFADNCLYLLANSVSMFTLEDTIAMAAGHVSS